MELHTMSIGLHRPLFRGGILTVGCADDLATIRRHRKRRSFHILLRVPGLALDKASVWESRLNAALKECGCSLGASCMLAALAGSIIWQFCYSSWSVSHWLEFLWRSTLAALAAGVIGKLSGLALAEGRIQAIEKQIRKFESGIRHGV